MGLVGDNLDRGPVVHGVFYVGGGLPEFINREVAPKGAKDNLRWRGHKRIRATGEHFPVVTDVHEVNTRYCYADRVPRVALDALERTELTPYLELLGAVVVCKRIRYGFPLPRVAAVPA
ncbi:hypothetical protein ATCV1_z290R [Acanthocystis turfacea chlorella virus 1]|uniref:Uncharacterized protein z290R n=1 Tax=Chlorovirus heliozoae TaxID=322019 RepID=A7K8Q0_9PHYC|nr:hypothetical protein ATCV1_z290R [Acanthocystis turfacea chlorella virus 1]ABT16424.1 hypothetical protein ATCV1_z290R [Acanthocystis turfacea chlorella virus 1]